MKIDKKIQLIRELMQEIKEEENHRDIKEFLSAYLEGLSWFENYRGGEVLSNEIDNLIQLAEDEYNIYCYDYQLKQMIKDRFDYWNSKTTKKEITKRIDHLNFIGEVKENTVKKIQEILKD